MAWDLPINTIYHFELDQVLTLALMSDEDEEIGVAECTLSLIMGSIHQTYGMTLSYRDSKIG